MQKIEKSGNIYLFHSYESEGRLRAALSELVDGKKDYTGMEMMTDYLWDEESIPTRVAKILRTYVPDDVWEQHVRVESSEDWTYTWVSPLSMLIEEIGKEKLIQEYLNQTGFEHVTITHLYIDTRMALIHPVLELSDEKRSNMKDKYGYDFQSYLKFPINIRYEIDDGSEFPTGLHAKLIRRILDLGNSAIEKHEIMQMHFWAFKEECKTEVTQTTTSTCFEADELISTNDESEGGETDA